MKKYVACAMLAFIAAAATFPASAGIGTVDTQVRQALVRYGLIDASGNPQTGVPTSRNVSTASPLTGGGNLTADRTISLPTNADVQFNSLGLGIASQTPAAKFFLLQTFGNKGLTIEAPSSGTDVSFEILAGVAAHESIQMFGIPAHIAMADANVGGVDVSLSRAAAGLFYIGTGSGSDHSGAIELGQLSFGTAPVGTATFSTSGAAVSISGQYASVASAAGSDTIDWNSGNVQTKTLSSGVNNGFVFTNGIAGGEYRLVLKQPASGSAGTTSWDAQIKWPSGTAPTLTVTHSKVDLLTFVFDGTNYYGTSSLNY